MEGERLPAFSPGYQVGAGTAMEAPLPGALAPLHYPALSPPPAPSTGPWTASPPWDLGGPRGKAATLADLSCILLTAPTSPPSSSPAWGIPAGNSGAGSKDFSQGPLMRTWALLLLLAPAHLPFPPRCSTELTRWGHRWGGAGRRRRGGCRGRPALAFRGPRFPCLGYELGTRRPSRPLPASIC